MGAGTGRIRYEDAKTLDGLFRERAKRSAGRAAYVDFNANTGRWRPRTWAEMYAAIGRWQAGFAQEGLNPGDRVALMQRNSPEWVMFDQAAYGEGLVTVPLYTVDRPDNVAYILADCSARLVLFDTQEQWDQFRVLKIDLPGVERILVLNPSGAPFGDPRVKSVAEWLPEAGVNRHVTDDAKRLASIFYTSGTTGFPKGAMTTHENFLANCETVNRVMRLPDGMRMRNLISVPMFHVTGCNSQLLIAVMKGGTAVIMPAFDVQLFLKTIVEERINVCVSVPAIYWLAMNQPNFKDFDMSGVRVLTYGGAPTAADVVGKIAAAWPNARLGNGFGLTETASVSTFLPHEYCDTRPETVGLAAPVIELDLFEVDPDTGVGELLIRGQNIVAGYWNKPEQTAETFVDGWLHTGDLAKLDDDGFCQIVDRKKDMVNRGGENVYCVEVEGAIVQHPDVFEVAVVGVPDEMMGEKVGAIIVPQPGSNPDPKDIRAFCKTLIADFKVPQYITFRKEPLPRNAGGKVLKPTLRKETVWGEQLRG